MYRYGTHRLRSTPSAGSISCHLTLVGFRCSNLHGVILMSGIQAIRGSSVSYAKYLRAPESTPCVQISIQSTYSVDMVSSFVRSCLT